VQENKDGVTLLLLLHIKWWRKCVDFE